MRLKELSEVLGLSQTTISRALNGYPEVSEKTRERVLAVAKANNYAPSQTALGLATGKAGAIGHIVPLGKHQMINPHFSDFIAGAGQTYARLGLDIVMTVADPDDELDAFRRLARHKRVDGFVIQGPTEDDKRIAVLTELGVPFAVHGRLGGSTRLSRTPEPYSWLDVNNVGAFERATNFLLDLGHRRIALVNGMERMTFANDRRAGFEVAMQDRGVAIDPELLFSEDMTEPYGFDTARHLLQLPADQRPTAILTASKLIASGCQRALGDAGMTLGRDISLLTFDDHLSFFGTHSVVPNVTCVRSSIFAAGKRVAEILSQAIDDPTAAPIQELWEADLIIGKSTGPAPQ